MSEQELKNKLINILRRSGIEIWSINKVLQKENLLQDNLLKMCSRNYRSNHSEVFLGKSVLKIGSKFTGEHTCQWVISIKLLCNFTEIALWHGCSPLNLQQIFRTRFLKITSEWLLLKLVMYLHSVLVNSLYCSNWIQEIPLWIWDFERGLSKTLTKFNFVFLKNTRSLQSLTRLPNIFRSFLPLMIHHLASFDALIQRELIIYYLKLF